MQQALESSRSSNSTGWGGEGGLATCPGHDDLYVQENTKYQKMCDFHVSFEQSEEDRKTTYNTSETATQTPEHIILA